MRQVLLSSVFCTFALAGQAQAQGFTAQELDRMSQERLINAEFYDKQWKIL